MQLERREYGLVDVKLARSEDNVGTFEGYGAVFGNVDSYGDVIQKGAFKKDLKSWESKGKWPKMLLQHGGMGIGLDDMMPIGQYTNMYEDSKGLRVAGRLFALNTERGQYIYEGLQAGELDSMSIGYQTVNSEEKVVDGELRRILTEIKLWEVSIVTFPANQKATITSVKDWTLQRLRAYENTLGERGLSRKDRLIAVSVLKDFQRDAGIGMSTASRDGITEDASDAIAAANELAAKIAAGCLKF